MKVIHWSPAKNKENILKNGILIQDTWVCCVPLTPFHKLNRWWLDFALNDTEYLGYIFELEESDFPLKYGHWAGDKEQEYDENYDLISSKRKTIEEFAQEDPEGHYTFKSLKELKEGYKETILWRIGETFDEHHTQESEVYVPNALKYLESPNTNIDEFIGDYNLMRFTFEDYQLLLFNNIPPSRIIKVVGSDEPYIYNDLLNELRNGI